MYKLLPNTWMGEAQVVQRLSDFAFIPFAPDNTDYIAYLRWLEEGNTVLPAEENQ